MIACINATDANDQHVLDVPASTTDSLRCITRPQQ